MATQNIQTDQLDHYWMPFTGNREFKKTPRMVTAAKGLHYVMANGQNVLDAASGLWCSSLGHGHPRIVEAIQRAASELDYAPAFQVGHPAAFELAAKISDFLPSPLNHVFFTNSGSEAVDTALKVAISYHRQRKEGSRTRFIGREKGYHGVGLGGTSVGGMANNRREFGTLLPGVDHLPLTHDLEHNAFSRGQPTWGAHLADALENLIDLHGAMNIAAVIVEPIAGSAGVFVPPIGYLERLREITQTHGILLIFDEVITGFGRLGTSSAAEAFGVIPDIITMAKAMTAGAVPMGGVAVSDEIFDSFMTQTGPGTEFFHGYTYSGHPLACAAGVAAMNVYRDEDIFSRVSQLTKYFEDTVHSLRDAQHVIDIRNFGLMSGIELRARSGKPGSRGHEAFLKGLEHGVYYRANGDTIAIAPPLICEESHIETAVTTLAKVLKSIN